LLSNYPHVIASVKWIFSIVFDLFSMEYSLYPLQSIRIAGSNQKNCSSQAWLLGRRFPEKYGKRDTTTKLKAEKSCDGRECRHLVVVSYLIFVGARSIQ